jgi:hypothetical protein
MCRDCGMEHCSDCHGRDDTFKRVCPLAYDGVHYSFVTIQHACRRAPDEFIPISRFSQGEVTQIISTIEANPVPPSPAFVMNDDIAESMRLADVERKVITIHRKHMTHQLFNSLWSTENPYPLLVTGHKLQIPWTPENFILLLGTQACKVQNCMTGEIIDSTIMEFFGRYGDESANRPVLRLKVFHPLLLYQNPTLRNYNSGLPTKFPLQDDETILLSIPRFSRFNFSARLRMP